jgi:hypothetical protein
MRGLMPVILGIGALGAGYFLFFTKEGKAMLDDITSGSGGSGSSEFDLNKWLTKDYPRSVARDPGAFIPSSERWFDIVAANRGEKEAKRLQKLQNNYIESYLGDAYY